METKQTPGPQEVETAALRAAAALMAGGAPLHELLEAISEFAARRMGAQCATILRFPGREGSEVIATWAGTSDSGVAPDHWSLDDDVVSTQLIRERRAVRVQDWGAIDDAVGQALSDRVGIRNSVGVPLVVGDQVWGALFIHSTEAALADDVDVSLAPFAHILAVTVSNAGRQSELLQLLAEQEALRRVAECVAHGRPSQEVFAVVAEEVGRALQVVTTRLIRFNADDTGTFVAGWGPVDGGTPTGATLPTGGTSVVGLIRSTGRPARVDDYNSVQGRLGAIVREGGITSAAGAPIVVDDRLWGALVVGSDLPSPLPSGAEDRVDAFARLVSMAISNIESRSRARRLLGEQASLRRVATAVARGDWPTILTTILEEVVAVSSADGAAMLRFDSTDAATVVAGIGEPGLVEYIGVTLLYGGDNPAAVAERTGRPARRDEWEGARGELAEMTRAAGIASSVAVPITVDGRTWGVIVVVSLDPASLPQETETRLGEFAKLVATAIDNLEARTALLESRVRIVTAVDRARQSIERDLHDGIQQRLVGLQIELARVHASLPSDEPGVRDELERVREQLGETLESVREIARGVHPAILSGGGLARALRGLTRRTPLISELRIDDLPSLPASIEVAAYYVVSEALANTVKHAAASRVSVRVGLEGARLVVQVEDDGVGGADTSAGSGLIGLVDRVEVLGGALSIRSEPGSGTALTATLPARR